MKELLGTEKQVKFAEKIRLEYKKHCDYLGVEFIDCEDSCFWIHQKSISNVELDAIKNRLLAWEWKSKGLNQSSAKKEAKSIGTKDSRNAYMYFCDNFVKQS